MPLIPSKDPQEIIRDAMLKKFEMSRTSPKVFSRAAADSVRQLKIVFVNCQLTNFDHIHKSLFAFQLSYFTYPFVEIQLQTEEYSLGLQGTHWDFDLMSSTLILR